MKDGLIKDKVYSFFKDKDEAIFVAEYLRKLDLVNLVAATYNEPFSLITVNGGISTLLKNGGLTKIAIDRENQRKKQAERQTKQDEILDLELRLKRFEAKIGKKIAIAGLFIAFLSFLITVVTLKFW